MRFLGIGEPVFGDRGVAYAAVLPWKPPRAFAREPRPWCTGAALASIGLVTVGAPQVLGGVYPPGVLAIAVVALAAFGFALASEPTRAPAWTALLAVMIAALGFTIVQALPLPCGLVEAIAEPAVEHLRRARHLLELGEPRRCTLSHDPGATREEIVKGVGILSAFVAARELSQRGYRRYVFGAVALSGVVLALVTIAHAAVSAERVFGVYEPVELREPGVLSPVLNPNNLGGLLAMGVPLLIGLAFEARAAPARLALLVATGIVASCVFMTGSRGGIGALFFGLALLAALAQWRRRTRRPTQDNRKQALTRLGTLLAVVAALGVSAYGWFEEVAAEFRGGDWDKVRMIAAGARFTLMHPWVGVGRGAFGSAFSVAHEESIRFEHAENLVVQWVSEWGVLVALPLIGLLAAALVRAMRRARSYDRIGALSGVTALAAQNLVDLGLELSGVATVAAVLLGGALATGGARRPLRPPVSRISRGAWALAGAAAAGLVVWLWHPIQRDHTASLTDALQARMRDDDANGARRILRRALLAHPAEPVFVVLGAGEALRRGDRRAGAWINRGMQLAPGWAAPHLQAAQWLFAAGRRQQGLLELGAALRRNLPASRRLLCSSAEQDLAGAIGVARGLGDRADVLEALSACFPESSAESARVDAIILKARPDDPAASLREGVRRLSAGDAAGALAFAEPALKIEHRRGRAVLLKARALTALDRVPEALELLRRFELQVHDPRRLLDEQARLHADRGDREAMLEALRRQRGLALGKPGALLRSFSLQANLERQLGNHGAALQAFEEAYGITGETRALQALARAADQAGNRRRAAWAWMRLCEVSGDEGACARKDAILKRARPHEPPTNAATSTPK